MDGALYFMHYYLGNTVFNVFNPHVDIFEIVAYLKMQLLVVG